MRRILLIATLAFGLATFGLAGPSDAAPDRQQGLVNVYAQDTTVQIPIGIAANVCGVAVNVLSQAANIGAVDCTAEGVAIAQDQGGGSPGVRQSGLVNVALIDTTVQVPVAVAANICGVAVNVLSASLPVGTVDCTALSGAGA